MRVLNLIGRPCPIPVIEAKKALRTASPGDLVAVLVDNDVSRQNLQKMAEGLGCRFSHETTAEGYIQATIEAAGGGRSPENDASGLVVAIGREIMGGGNEELGRALMKSFIYSLTELDLPPEYLLFFNQGVLWTTKGSAAADDLLTLQSRGSIISSCGACLNFFGLTDALLVGDVTNMFAIAGTMAQAARLINL